MALEESGGCVMGGTRRTVVGLLVAAFLAVSVWAATPSNAFIFVVPSTGWPSSGIVGQTIEASVGLGNFSTPPESTSNPVLGAAAIDLYPACSNGAGDCSGGTVEPDVYELTGPFVGQSTPPGNATCEGNWTATEAAPGPLALRTSGK